MFDKSILSLSDSEVASRDLIELNLAVGADLPGARDVDSQRCLRRVGEWTDMVACATQRMFSQGNRDKYADWTDNQFRLLVMATILQRDLGVAYNLAFNVGEYDARDGRNVFVQGLLSGVGGTCVTMPVLYAGIGRRLGYPIRIVSALGHWFCRWDAPHERFNIEATQRGFEPRDDEYYRHWPGSLPESGIRDGWFLRSLTPREELASFLFERGNCCLDNLALNPAVAAYGAVTRMVPQHPAYHRYESAARMIRRALHGRPNPLAVAAHDPQHVLRWLLPDDEDDASLFSFAYTDLSRILHLQMGSSLEHCRLRSHREDFRAIFEGA